MTIHTLDRHNAAINRARVDACCARGQAIIRTRNAPFTATVTGNLYTRRDGVPLIVYRNGGKWYAAEVESGYTLSHRGYTTRDAAMIESHNTSRSIAA